jgi:glycosyltransferase involved in cell wall biosynthesis
MKVLLLHNRYRLTGGEDGVMKAETDMLRARGIDVLEHQVDNGSDGDRVSALQLAWGSAWSRRSYEEIRAVCERFRPDVAHVHNFWMRLSPSVHAACKASGAATVQTLHNFRLLCANAVMLRDGKVCRDCVGKLPWRGVVRRCYRDSTTASAAVTAMIGVNRLRGTWKRDVDAFIALTEHSRGEFVAGGLPAERIFVKPNFRRDTGAPTSLPSAFDTIVYAGRLSQEKGIDFLLSAWAQKDLSRFGKLLIVGQGDLQKALEQQAEQLGLRPPAVVFAGQRNTSEIPGILARARAMVLPSLYFECFPMNVLEAFAGGRPMIASRHGALGELVRNGELGLTALPGDAAALGGAIAQLLQDGSLADRLGRQARAEYLERYTDEQNARILFGIYDIARQSRGANTGIVQHLIPAMEGKHASY